MNDTKSFKNLKFSDKLVKVYLLVKKVEMLSGAIVLLGIVTDVFGFFGISIFNIFPKLKSIFFENEQTNELYDFTRGVFIFLFIVSICLTLIIYIGNKWYADCTLIRQKLYGNIIDKMIYDKKHISGKIHEAILENKYKKIFEFSSNTNVTNPFTIKKSRVNPMSAIDKIVDSAGELLSAGMGFEKNNEYLSICLAYKDKTKNKWMVCSYHGSQISDADIEGLFEENKPSSFNYVLKNRKEEVFYLNKQKAIYDGKYYRLPNEKNDSINGSVYCKNLSIYDNNNEMVEGLLLSINTKQYAFCNNDDFSVEQCQKTFKYIESMISYEFTKFYLYNYCGLGE